MYPYIHLGSLPLGTFGLLLWLAAVLAAVVLHRTFQRDGVDADALNVVAMVVIAGILGSKLWHELQEPAQLAAAWRLILQPGWHHPGQVLGEFFSWFKAGFAWYGGLIAGIAMLLFQGVTARPNGVRGGRAGVRMLDLAAAAAAVGYGIGRLGCLTSGDGDYGRNTTSTLWGVHMRPDALVPPKPPTALVLPTPLWEFAIAMLFALLLWQLGKRARPLGWLTGLYLLLSGSARFLIEFWRINPKLYLNHMLSNAQVASLATIFVGFVILFAVRGTRPVGGAAATPLPAPVAEPEPTPAPLHT